MKGDDELTLLKFKSNQTSFAVCLKAVLPTTKFCLLCLLPNNSLYSAAKSVVCRFIYFNTTDGYISRDDCIYIRCTRVNASLFPAIDTQRQLYGYGELMKSGKRTILEFVSV